MRDERGRFCGRPLDTSGCKECRDCGIEKSLDDFHAHTLNKDGSVRLWQPYCKLCLRDRTRFYATQRRRRLGIPKRGNGQYRLRQHDECVPIGPFVEWLQSYLSRTGTTVVELAARCSVDDSRLNKFATGSIKQANVTIGYVDRVLVYSRTNTQLWELYP